MSLKKTENLKQTNLIEFSFCDHKSSFETIFIHPEKQEPILEDIRDFWKFVNKYESMLRSAGQPILADPFVSFDLEEGNKFQHFHKRNFIPLKLAYDPQRCFDRYMHKNKDLSVLKIQQFSEIVLLYMDFKQKEKFSKIRKLRKSQACLPITKYKNDIEQALKENQVLIVAGDTGCGKSTQIPQYLYQYGFRNIACTQPRRLACVSLSKRVAFEMLDDYGSKVGFQIRFEKNKTSNTNILFITEGLLLRQLAVDSNLEQYDVLILDEIHERNLYGDFLLGVTKCLLRAKRDLKLVLMSATINIELFKNYFKDEGANLIEVPGRLFPIKTIYLPPPALELKRSGARSTSVRLDPGPYIQVLNLIDQKYPLSERGDVLIFASGVNEITTICDAAKEYSEKSNHWIILALHSGLSLADQDKVFDYAPERMRKCIVSTNIAETSLTVDGIRFVVDSGKVKEMSYDALSKGQRLKEFWVSKSSAEQRKGRAGRTGPGVCYRIFSEKQFESLEPYPTPEIFRVPLESILLQMISMGLPNVRVFPFIESPTEENIEQTILTLKQHNALSVDEKITPLGRALSNLPVDIAIGKMLLMGCALTDTVDKILTFAAMLSVQTPFTSRAYIDKTCTEKRLEFESDQGDIFTLLNAYHEWLGLKLDRLENTRKWCYKMGLEEQRFYDIAKLRNQFQNILEINNMLPSRNKDSLSSADRSRRHGEVRALKAIKRKQKYQEPRKRKVLKRSQENEEDFTVNTDDIRDVDFRLTYDLKKMEILHASSEARMHRDVILLKIIAVSGFYPQISFPDEFNYCKGGSQQFFHTHLKQFISIHPNSGFAKNFEILKLNDSDILDKPSYYTPKQPLSTAYQVLCYQNLLETAKVYLMNPIRMPAAQTLLLFSFSIDTNISISRIVCDSWLCLEFPIPETGKELLKRAIKLRNKWSRMLNAKIKDFSNSLEADAMSSKKNTKEDHIDLWDDMTSFMDTSVAYTVKRLLPADLKNLYNEQPLDPKVLNPNPFLENVDTVANKEKGGLDLTENVVYGCLREVQWTIEMDAQMMEHTWECPVCSEVVQMNGINKLIHEAKCMRSKEKPKKQEERKHTTGDTEYTCAKCNRTLFLSAIDILRHKRKC